MSLSTSALTLGIGSTETLTATAKNQSGASLSGKSFTWSSSDASIATVGATSGVVTAVSAGSAVITATSESKIGTALVVTATPVSSVVVTPAAPSVLVGGTYQLTAVARDAANNSLIGRTVTWSSSNTSAATVSATGLVTALAAGTATITATVEGKTATTTVTAGTQTTPGVISMGSLSTACGLTLTGKLYCWGSRITPHPLNPDGSTNISSLVPMLANMTFKSVSVGEFHACAITTAGMTYCFGHNNYGQLGTGNLDPWVPEAPLPVTGGRVFVAVEAGAGHTLGLTATGEVYAWGWNAVGQLGDGTTTNRSAPTLVSGGRTYTSIAAGEQQSFALTTTGAAYGWGGSGQLLGTSTSFTGNVVVPAPVLGGLSFARISTSNAQTIAITAAGVPYIWNPNTGTGVPQLVPGNFTFVAVSAGRSQLLGLTSTGAVYGWGELSGDGSNPPVPRTTPVPIMPTKTFTAIDAGGYNSTILSTEGDAWTWGQDNGGIVRLGNHNNDFINTPLIAPPPTVLLTSATAKSITAGTSMVLDVQVTPTAGGFHSKSAMDVFGSTVTLAVEGLPSGVTATVSPSPVTPGITAAQIYIVASPSATVGSKTVTIRASSPGMPDVTRTVTLTVAAGSGTGTGSANLDCNAPATVTAPYQCMTNSAGQKVPGRYDYTDIHGQWADEGAEICIDWKSTGKAAVKFKGGSWSAEKEWGVIVKKSGVPEGTATQWYIFTAAADAQTQLLGYDSSAKSIMGWHFVKKTCPF